MVHREEVLTDWCKVNNLDPDVDKEMVIVVPWCSGSREPHPAAQQR